jgi:hypothetical protein
MRNGWARPAKRVPAQHSLPPPNHIVPSPPFSGTEGVLAPIATAGVSGRWATAQTGSKSHRRPTVPYHSPIICATAFSRAPWHDVRGGRFATEKRSRVLLPIGWPFAIDLRPLCSSGDHRLRPLVIAQLCSLFLHLPAPRGGHEAATACATSPGNKPSPTLASPSLPRVIVRGGPQAALSVSLDARDLSSCPTCLSAARSAALPPAAPDSINLAT